MLIGYARVSTQDQTLQLQHDALTDGGCEKLFREGRVAKQDRRHVTGERGPINLSSPIALHHRTKGGKYVGSHAGNRDRPGKVIRSGRGLPSSRMYTPSLCGVRPIAR